MSDSFADLWTSSAPSKPAQNQRLGAAAAASPSLPARKGQADVFALLSSAGSSKPASRSITPSASPANPAAKASSTSGDAFSNLLGSSLRNSANDANMTIAERAAKAERERKNQFQNTSIQNNIPKSSAWDGLDTLAAPGQRPKIVQPEEDDWGLSDFAAQPAPALPPRARPVQPTQQLQQSKPQKSGGSIWDDESFVSQHSRSNTPGDFDFGNREDAQDSPDEDDDVLGILSKPVHAIPKQSLLPSSNINSSNGSRANSPPPHVIGQIVEMGFSPQQARVALAATDTGLDVQSALETLLSNGAGSESTRPQETEPVLPPPRRQKRPEPRQDATPSPSMGIQTDQILTQASEIGLNMFNRANAFWTSGKEKVQKVYEERVASTSSSEEPRSRPSNSRTGSGLATKPRWMQEQEQGLGVRQDADNGWDDDEPSGFSDDIIPSNKPANKPAKHAPFAPAAAEPAVDLFSSEPVAYVSPFRRGKAKAAPLPAQPAAVARAPSPIALRQRDAVSASSSDISVSAKHKAEGGDRFKLGQYAEAEAAYAAAIDPLPSNHLLLVPLYNNRALTRLKTGDYTGAVDDCTAVIDIIGSQYHPRKEARVSREDQGSSVDLADGFVKALKRRAEAWEGKEKWDSAKADWESVIAADWINASLRNEGVKGIGRCRKMTTSGPPPPKPKARPKAPVAALKQTNSEALSNLRKANDAAEAEDQERHDLKDVVDGKLIAWKGGKETNIRALIASLDLVLWPELGWQKVGMSDLISPGQVKVRYTKAIAKLHPDKLNVGNTALEHRMIANGVFGALNEAWNVFKQ